MSLPVPKYFSDLMVTSSDGETTYVNIGMKYNFSIPINSNVAPNKVPKSVSEATETLLYFFGPARSGTTFVNEAINSHPHVIMTNERGLVTDYANGRVPLPTKKAFVDLVWRYGYAYFFQQLIV